MIHEAAHPLSGYNVDLRHGVAFHVHDWYDRVHDVPHASSDYQIAIDYAARRQGTDIPDDDNVVYGWFEDGTEALIHMIEFEDFQGF